MQSKFNYLLLLLIIFSAVLQAEIDPSDTPENTQSYDLNDLYNRLESGAAGSQSAFTEPGAAPGATMRTLNDIMSIAPAVHGNPADASEVVDGKYFWSLMSGSWGPTEGAHVCPVYPDPIPKTGQTSPDSEGSDGDLQKGLEWPNPRFTDNNNGTVTDNLTGLVWLKDANCFGDNWQGAVDFCTVLADGICGLEDDSEPGEWRLPNVKEMYSLIDYGYFFPAFPAVHPFINVAAEYYWTSTSTLFGDYPFEQAYTVHLNGYIWGDAKEEMYRLWPVRDSN